MKKKALVLLSGGLDSVVALYHAQQEYELTLALSFYYGAKHNEKELACAEWQAATLGISHKIIDISLIGQHLDSSLLLSGGDIPEGNYDAENMKQTIVPFRNGIMLSVAAGVAESVHAQVLIIASHAGDHSIYPDCRPEFVLAMGQAIKEGTQEGIEVVAPFSFINKAQIAQRGQELGVDFSHTWSCYKGGERHCGLCATCLERKEALATLSCLDPSCYEVG